MGTQHERQVGRERKGKEAPPVAIFDAAELVEGIIKPSEITVSKIEDIGSLAVVKSFVADSYIEFHSKFNKARAKKRTKAHNNLHETVLGIVCNDDFGSSDRSTTFAAFTENADLVGGERVGEGQEGVRYPLETLMLWRHKKTMDPDKKIEAWPHRVDGLNDSEVGELARIVIAKGQRGRNTEVILKSLVDKAFEHAREKGIQQLYVTLPTVPPKLYDRLGREGIGLELEYVAHAELRRDLAEAKKVFEEFSIYWENRHPRLYRIKVPAAEAA